MYISGNVNGETDRLECVIQGEAKLSVIHGLGIADIHISGKTNQHVTHECRNVVIIIHTAHIMVENKDIEIFFDPVNRIRVTDRYGSVFIEIKF